MTENHPCRMPLPFHLWGLLSVKETPIRLSLEQETGMIRANVGNCVTVLLTLSRSFFHFLGSKFLLFLYCRAISQYNAANILATDHRNDLLVNGFGLFASLLSRYCWWLDAAGAIVVSLIILRSWVWTAYGKEGHAQYSKRDQGRLAIETRH